MKRSFLFSSLVLVTSVFSLAAVNEQPADGAARIALASPRVHQEANALFAHLARFGETLPVFESSARFEKTGQLPVLVRFLSAPSTTAIESMQAKARANGGLVTFDRKTPIANGAWQLTVDQRGLETLAANDNVARVSVDLRHRAPRPLDQSQIETNAAVAKRASIAKNGTRLDGKGTVIADIDSPIYIHHPSFFHADGGAFAWIDVNKDKKLTPGKDGIDLDGSGTIEPNEVLQDMRSQAISRYTKATIDDHEDFTPDLDYLYLDTNGNGTRDHGPKGGSFGESTPAYGEPMYVFDDANHDGITDVTERVLQLKTSKIKMVESQAIEYKRGQSGSTGLLKYDPESDPKMAAAMGHATGVAGILVGGVSGVSKWLGLAPEAELIVNDSTSDRGQTSSVQWAIDHKANVILTEYAPYTGVSLDGSSEDETILDAANDQGIVTVSPAGNLAGGHKHRTVTLQAGATTKINVGTNVSSRYAAVSLHYKGATRELTVKLKRPDGTTLDIPESEPNGAPQADGSYLYVMGQTTPRGTHERFLYLIGKTEFAEGAYELSITLDAGAPLEVDMFASDEVSSWAGGFTFDQDTPSRTICSPSTSDKTISVAAYVLHDEEAFYPAGKKGDVASYSSRGPTFDGKPGIEIGAPDNPLSAAPPAEKGEVGNAKSATWEPFGGTSGAGPHVTAAVVLVKQAFPEASPSDIKKKLLDAAKPVSGVDETSIGKGKLDIAKAIGATVASGDAPKAKLEVVTPAHPGADATVRVSATDDEAKDVLSARWDLDYDGTFDTEWLPLGDQVVAVNDAAIGSQLAVKVEVRDGQGNINGATMTVDVTDATATGAPPATTTTTTSEDGCGCRTVRASSSGAAGLLLTSIAIAMIAARRRRRLAA